MNFYDFSARGLNEHEVKMEEYKGKVVIVVNIASKCGFTSQLKELEEIYNEYKDRGFVVLGFPCAQFTADEPQDKEELVEFYVNSSGITFPLFEKADVNGKTAHPLFKYLKSQDPEYFAGEIKWNFTKYLLNTEGKVVKKFAPTVLPSNMKKEIEGLLK
ncbi:glutathione peroxidase [Anaeromicropila populeti]|uniref:Glutathione peroxidase n=1 Tax=Anaeromicropila populeti TaxID=37658 RepID=A0A1I6HLV3_9FIRM|nr:glutathione peroxidase [Anaeromicropila populeti]SFR55378.1 glutathione peroxidase [Anaeromicropila populeti]